MPNRIFRPGPSNRKTALDGFCDVGYTFNPEFGRLFGSSSHLTYGLYSVPFKTTAQRQEIRSQTDPSEDKDQKA